MILDWRTDHDLGPGRLFDAFDDEINLPCYFINTDTGEVEFYIPTIVKGKTSKAMNLGRTAMVEGKATLAAPLRFVAS